MGKIMWMVPGPDVPTLAVFDLGFLIENCVLKCHLVDGFSNGRFAFILLNPLGFLGSMEERKQIGSMLIIQIYIYIYVCVMYIYIYISYISLSQSEQFNSFCTGFA